MNDAQMPRTVGELRTALATFPDDMPVMVVRELSNSGVSPTLVTRLIQLIPDTEPPEGHLTRPGRTDVLLLLGD